MNSEPKNDEKYFRLANAPEEQPLAFDLREGKLYTDKHQDDEDSIIDLDKAHSVAQMRSTLNQSRPKWLKEFFEQMNGYVSQASDKAEIDSETGQLSLHPDMTKSKLKEVCGNLAWLYEAQYRQNKEILLWIGELILDYMARAVTDMTIEEAIEELGLLDRSNGVKWKLKTLARWPVVVQRIPAPIRQLPIPPTYLSEAALFAQPDDVEDKIKFNNSRDAMLVAVSEKPDVWSRSKFVACMKELQDHFGMERSRNEGVSQLQERLIAYYRLQREAEGTNDIGAFYGNIGLDRKDVSQWIYNIEAALVDRNRMTASPTDQIPRGDGLTQTARERVMKTSAGKGYHPK